MFEKLITDLKNSLPAPIRKKLGMAEDSSENEEVESQESHEDSDDSASSPAVDSEEEQKKKRKSMIVKVVVILALGYLAVDEFVLKKPDVATEEAVYVPKRKRPVKKVEEGAPAATTETATATTPTPNSDTSATTETPPAETAEASSSSQDSSELSAYQPAGSTESAETSTPPIENVNILSKNETPDQKIDQLLDEVDTNSESSMPSSSETSSASSSSSGSSSVGESTTTSTTTAAQDAFNPTVDTSMEIPTELPAEQIIIPSQPKKSDGNSMASKISEDAVETPPPAYDQVGRGLVYNCKGKYWACLNKTAYVECNKNMKWNKSKGAAAECVVQNIYSSDEDCAKIQKYNVSTNVATNFCQN